MVTSLAGRTQAPVPLPGEVRSGGFGGAAGLAAFLQEKGIGRLVDATHPFAAIIGRHAAEACVAIGIPRCRLLRPPWRPVAGDRWHEVETFEQAAALLPTLGRRALLTTGHEGLEHFEALSRMELVVRSIERPPALPAGATWIGTRGPFRFEDELRLLRERRIDVVVSKQSGGAATYPKIEAARALGLPVLMLARPAPPPGQVVETVEEAVAWLAQAEDLAGRST